METTTVDIWILEGDEGSMIFDSPPGNIHNYTDGLGSQVKLYACTARIESSDLVEEHNYNERDSNG